MIDSDDKRQNGRNSDEISDTKPKRTFDGWDEVPREYRMRSGWQSAFRRVKKDESPQAVVVLRRRKKYESFDGEQEIVTEQNLFHVSQTQPIKKTPLNVARHQFYRIFAQPADRQRYIKWTKGGWFEDNGTRYWNAAIDNWSWRVYSQWLSKQNIVDHLVGKEIIGVFGAENSHYLLIDLDLHKQSLTLFLRRLSVLLDAFHGRYRCHFQVTDVDAAGIHLLLYFGKPSPLGERRACLTRELGQLHERHPACKLFVTKNGEQKLNIEIFPGTNPHRLPLARQRTMLLDQPLERISHRGRLVQDVVGYMKWLNNPHRTYMDKDEVYRFVFCAHSWFQRDIPHIPRQQHLSIPATEWLLRTHSETVIILRVFAIRRIVTHLYRIRS